MRQLPLVACFAALIATPAAATQINTATQCGPLASISGWLSANTAETSVVMERLDDAHAVQLWRAPDGSTWTLLLVRPTGAACIIAHGTRWDIPVVVAQGREG